MNREMSNKLIKELMELRERMRRVVGMCDSDIDLVTQAIDKIREQDEEINPVFGR